MAGVVCRVRALIRVRLVSRPRLLVLTSSGVSSGRMVLIIVSVCCDSFGFRVTVRQWSRLRLSGRVVTVFALALL